MITGAVWYLDQLATHKWGGKAAIRAVQIDDSLAGPMIIAGFAWGLVPAAHIAAVPYSKIVRTTQDIRSFLYRTSHYYIFPKGSARARNKLLAKIGARAVPGLGWALLAYDLYSAGKYLHGRGYRLPSMSYFYDESRSS